MKISIQFVNAIHKYNFTPFEEQKKQLPPRTFLQGLPIHYVSVGNSVG